MEQAIHKMTFLPAKRLGLRNVGQIKEGSYADLAIFDPVGIMDKSTHKNPCRYPEGIEYALVSGVIVVKGGEPTDALPGRVLRNQSRQTNG